nr:uncharacterized protein LOC109184888 [Ipomoea trifida]
MDTNVPCQPFPPLGDGDLDTTLDATTDPGLENEEFDKEVVYELYSVVERRDLWNHLRHLAPPTNLPWIIGGKFQRGPQAG